MDAHGLRTAFTRYFVDRGHTALAPSGLIPHDPSILFTIAGMVQFKPYFTGEQQAPVDRATTIQPCFRTNDIDLIGTTARHNTFFEMLGNFSFGDYFKESAIPFAWGFVTEVLGFDPEQLWVTVHESDNDAAGIWQEVAGVKAERIQEMGEDNFWRMGDVGPCGPCSEIYLDRGPKYGADGGPKFGGEDRFVEMWNLVFMQFERLRDGTLLDLPKKNIDTGAGLERILAAVQGVHSIFETDAMTPILDAAQSISGKKAGSSEQVDKALRIIGDHSRAMTFLVSDGVFPSNEGRGYVLRRIIRRAVMRAQQLGITDTVMPQLADVVIANNKAAYPKLEKDASLIATVVAHEEESFRRTLRAGETLFGEELAKGATAISGDVAFKLHDTFGFPIDLTVEMAEQNNVTVDREGFDREMTEQRDRARRAGVGAKANDDSTKEMWTDLLTQFGPTKFVGYNETTTSSRVLAIHERADAETYVNIDGDTVPKGSSLFELVLDTTPFYAEGGGQVGDTGIITSDTGTFRVIDTKVVHEKLSGHLGYFTSGEINSGELVTATIDVKRRNSIRRNHTGTHLLHHALRHVLGDHVRQQGSLVTPDRMRFDFSHFAPLSAEELTTVIDMVNEAVLTDGVVKIYETSKAEAEEAGAMAFFGDKYGDVVRVIEAGDSSVELCGGTHVSALGMIGLFRVVSEASIGSNTRRIEATTGERSLADVSQMTKTLERTAEVLHATPLDVVEVAERVVGQQRELEDQLRAVKSGQLKDEANALASSVVNGRIIARRDGLDANAIRELALSLRDLPEVSVVALIGAADEAKVALVVATTADSGVDAKAIAADAAKLVSGGGGGSKELATAGGRDVAAIDKALARLTELLSVSS